MIKKNENSEIFTIAERSKPNRLFCFISVVLPIATVIVPIVLFFIEFKEKELSYEILGRTELVGVHLPSDEISITYSGKKVSYLELISINLSNSGNVPIKSEDFDRPLKIKFEDESEVFVVRVGASFPENLRPIIKSEPGLIQITPLLLNPGDNYTIEVITSAKEQVPLIDVRIAGIQNPKFINRAGINQPDMPQKLRLVALIFSFSLYAFLFGTLLGPYRVSPGIKIQRIESFIATMAAASISALLFLDYSKKMIPLKFADILLAILPIVLILTYLAIRKAWLKTINY